VLKEEEQKSDVLSHLRQRIEQYCRFL